MKGVLSTLDFADFETCVNCIKGKQSNKFKKDAQRSSNLLEIIHTYTCCPQTWTQVVQNTLSPL